MMSSIVDSPPRLAFFDVDETLIAAKSMFAFLKFHLAEAGDDGSEYEARVSALRACAALADRSEVNRAYYRYFAGASWDELMAQGLRWYAEYLTQPMPFIPAGVAAVRGHQAAGDRIVLVSGSFLPCLSPIAEQFHAYQVCCTRPVVDNAGRLTGEVGIPMIGPAKGRVVRDTLAVAGVSREACFGYADHASDIDMLAAVGNPTVIGADEVLVAHAQANGWPVLPAQGAYGQALTR